MLPLVSMPPGPDDPAAPGKIGGLDRPGPSLEYEQPENAGCGGADQGAEDVQAPEVAEQNQAHEDIHAIRAQTIEEILAARRQEIFSHLLAVKWENRDQVEEEQDQVDPDELKEQAAQECIRETGS